MRHRIGMAYVFDPANVRCEACGKVTGGLPPVSVRSVALPVGGGTEGT